MLKNNDENVLQRFTAEQIAQNKGAADFFGLNHYTTRLVTDGDASGGNQNFIERVFIPFRKQRSRLDGTHVPPVAASRIRMAVFRTMGIQEAPELHSPAIRFRNVPNLRDRKWRIISGKRHRPRA